MIIDKTINEIPSLSPQCLYACIIRQLSNSVWLKDQVLTRVSNFSFRQVINRGGEISEFGHKYGKDFAKRPYTRTHFFSRYTPRILIKF